MSKLNSVFSTIKKFFGKTYEAFPVLKDFCAESYELASDVSELVTLLEAHVQSFSQDEVLVEKLSEVKGDSARVRENWDHVKSLF